MDDAIRAALAAAAPGRSVASVAAPDGSANPGNRTVRVRFADGETAFLKVAVDGNRTRLAWAAAVVAYAGAGTDVPVPRVLAADPDADPPYLLTAPLAGTPVVEAWATRSVDERATLLRAVGRALAGVHAARFAHAGRIVGGDAAALDVEERAWPDVVAGLIDGGGGDWEEGDGEGDGSESGGSDDGRFTDFAGRASEVVRARREELALGGPGDEVGGGGERPAPALLHNDPRPENAFRDVERVGLIDWEQAMVGDPTLDIVKTEGRFLQHPDTPGRERLREALWDGYRERAGGLPAGFDWRRRVYRVVTFVGVARGFDEWGPEVDEPDAELAEWVRSAFEERLDQV